MIRSKAIILSIIILTFVFSLSMMSLTIYHGVSNTEESGYMVSIEQTTSMTIKEGEIVGGDYDVKKENLNSDSQDIFETVRSNTGFRDSYDSVLFEKDELTPQLISEPLVCDDCYVESDLDEADEENVDTGITISDGYYQVSVDKYNPESKFNYIGFTFWSFISFFSLILLGIFILKLK